MLAYPVKSATGLREVLDHQGASHENGALGTAYDEMHLCTSGTPPTNFKPVCTEENLSQNTQKQGIKVRTLTGVAQNAQQNHSKEKG